MDNKIQNGFVPQGQFNQQAPAFNAFGGFQNFQTQFNNFVNKLSTTMNPDAMAAYAENQIRAGLQNGSISQEAFNQMAMMANQMLGR